MLRKIKQYLVKRNIPIALDELARAFNVEADTMRCMLSHWIRKGKIIQYKNHCGLSSKCNGCSASSLEYYAWSEQKLPMTIVAG